MATRAPSCGQPQGDAAADAFGGAGDQDHFAGAGLHAPVTPRALHALRSPPAPRLRASGSGSRPVRCAQPQNIAVVELSAPGDGADRRADPSIARRPRRASSRASSPTTGSIPWWQTPGRGTRSGTMRSSCDMFSTELTPTPARDSAMKTSAQRKLPHLAEQDVRPAVHHVADDDGALVVAEAQAAAQGVGQRAAAQQADAGESPDHAEAGRAAVEHESRRRR